MKLPEGMRITAKRVEDGRVILEIEVDSVTHACPPAGSGLTPCCGRSPFELSRWDRLAEAPALVTCKGAEAEG